MPSTEGHPVTSLEAPFSKYSDAATSGTVKCFGRRKSRCRARLGSAQRHESTIQDSKAMSELIVGIDLGTTNSEIAAFADGQVRVLGPGDTRMLPSCVGVSPAGELLVGQMARNQQALYPERTVRSIK